MPHSQVIVSQIRTQHLTPYGTSTLCCMKMYARVEREMLGKLFARLFATKNARRLSFSHRNKSKSDVCKWRKIFTKRSITINIHENNIQQMPKQVLEPECKRKRGHREAS